MPPPSVTGTRGITLSRNSRSGSEQLAERWQLYFALTSFVHYWWDLTEGVTHCHSCFDHNRDPLKYADEKKVYILSYQILKKEVICSCKTAMINNLKSNLLWAYLILVFWMENSFSSRYINLIQIPVQDKVQTINWKTFYHCICTEFIQFPQRCKTFSKVSKTNEVKFWINFIKNKNKKNVKIKKKLRKRHPSNH